MLEYILAKIRHEELLKEAEKQRMLKEARKQLEVLQGSNVEKESALKEEKVRAKA